jgi:ureidoacrylate peracid hydrolase
MRPLRDLIEPSKTAIVVVDVQNDFCHPDGNSAKNGADVSSALAILPALQRFLDAGREFGAKIVFVQKIHEDCTDSEPWLARGDGKPGTSCRKGTWGADFIGVAPAANEPVVFSHRYSAFVNSRLDTVLRTYKVENLIMTGVASNVCVESTARHGYMLDYNIVFLSDCSASYSKDAHEMALHNIGSYFGVVAESTDVVDAWTAAHAVALPL